MGRRGILKRADTASSVCLFALWSRTWRIGLGAGFVIQSTTIQADWMNGGFVVMGQEASASGVCDSHNRGWFTSLDGIMVRVGNRAPSNTRPSQLIRRAVRK